MNFEEAAKRKIDPIEAFHIAKREDKLIEFVEVFGAQSVASLLTRSPHGAWLRNGCLEVAQEEKDIFDFLFETGDVQAYQYLHAKCLLKAWMFMEFAFWEYFERGRLSCAVNMHNEPFRDYLLEGTKKITNRHFFMSWEFAARLSPYDLWEAEDRNEPSRAVSRVARWGNPDFKPLMKNHDVPFEFPMKGPCFSKPSVVPFFYVKIGGSIIHRAHYPAKMNHIAPLCDRKHQHGATSFLPSKGNLCVYCFPRHYPEDAKNRERIESLIEKMREYERLKKEERVA